MKRAVLEYRLRASLIERGQCHSQRRMQYQAHVKTEEAIMSSFLLMALSTARRCTGVMDSRISGGMYPWLWAISSTSALASSWLRSAMTGTVHLMSTIVTTTGTPSTPAKQAGGDGSGRYRSGQRAPLSIPYLLVEREYPGLGAEGALREPMARLGLECG